MCKFKFANLSKESKWIYQGSRQAKKPITKLLVKHPLVKYFIHLCDWILKNYIITRKISVDHRFNKQVKLRHSGSHFFFKSSPFQNQNANYEPVRLVHSYINPQRSVPLEVVRIHGLDDLFLSDKPTFDRIAPEFVRFVRGAELIAHNASFDVGFINHELSLSSFDTLEALGCSVTCSLKLARRTLHARHNRLDDLCQRFQIDNSDRQLHGALKDCLLLAQVLACLERYTVSIMGNNR